MGYAGTAYDLALETLHYDYDNYNYWDDVEFGDDLYWDPENVDGGSVQKRKRDASAVIDHKDKRRKIEVDASPDLVCYCSLSLRVEKSMRFAPQLEHLDSFALLPDWKKRFADHDGNFASKEMPLEMKHAAEGKEMEKVIAEDEDEEDEDLEDGHSALPDLETIKAVLKERLGGAGLDGLDDETIVHLLSRMMSGEEGANEAADDLTGRLLGQAQGGNDQALSFLSQQGVTLDADEEDDEEDHSSVSTADPLTAVPGKVKQKGVQVSPSDSAVELNKTNGGAETDNYSPTASAKKRAAPAERVEIARKQRKVTFDESVQETPTTNLQDSLPSEHHSTAPPVIAEESTTAANTESLNAVAAKKNKAPTTDNTENHLAESTSAEQNEEEAEAEESLPPAKAARKRKAQREADDLDSGAHTRKRQARKPNVSADGPAQAAGRRTRASAKAKK